MTLLGNHYRQGGTPVTNHLGSTNIGSFDRQHAYQPGKVRGFYLGAACTEDVQVQSFPPGYRHPAAWFLSPKAGGISAKRSGFTLSAVAPAEGGLEGSATTTLTLSITSAQGDLIADGSGTAQITLTVTSATLDGAIDGSGTATITLSASAAAISALAEIGGSASITLNCSSASIEGIGEISGESTPFTELSPQGLADALVNYPVEGDETLGDAIRLITAVLAGEATDLDGNAVFLSRDGGKIRVTATRSGGSRTPITRDGTE